MTKNHLLSLSSWIAQGTGNIVSDMDGEKVMLSIQNGKYYNLGKIGGEIWGKIEKPITVNQLINELMDLYSVEREECEDHVLSFLDMLADQNLIMLEERVGQ